MDSETRSYLYKLAKERKTIGYKEMCIACYKDLNFDQFADKSELYRRLTKISEFEDFEERPLLSVLVVKTWDDDNKTEMPGEGFFTMASNLEKCNKGLNFEEKKIFFDSEFKKVCSL